MESPIRRCANVLALSAMLALSLVPGLGRIWTAHAGITVAGPHAVQHGDARMGADGRKVPRAGAHGDCAYCPLLAATTLADHAAPPVHAWFASATQPQLHAVDGELSRPSGGLGARGPPATA
jgi:hypothetical protein